TDAALARSGGDWRIIGVNLRSTEIVHTLRQQNSLYSVLEKGRDGMQIRLIGSLHSALAASEDREAVVRQLTDPAIRIVSLTVTEKAYGLKQPTGELDRQHADVAHDLAQLQHPRGVLGMLVEGLRRRWQAGIAPYTVLCCDNLPANGRLLRTAVLAFAGEVNAELAAWIAAEVAFPSTMVDRITPAVTPATLAEAAQWLGCVDEAVVETESFSQWVIEDHFPQGRPDWEAGGALFVADVAPYEQMKLRMLNGSHSMLAYAGFLAGCAYVRDVMAHPQLKPLVERHLQAAAATLSPLPGMDFHEYAQQLLRRFENPAIAHQTYQIAMDGTQKLPQRLLEPAVQALEQGQDVEPFAFAVAAWMRYCRGGKADGETYALRDPREAEIRAALAGAGEDAVSISAALHALPGLFPQALIESGEWREQVVAALDSALRV
ncbi:MAG: mannitol dehydrogenase family protein, partial [Thiolinea sp.]